MSGPDGSLSNSVGEFAELVAAGTPTPGGGSVAAYCGALATALGRMVCNLSIGKKKYAEHEPRLLEIRDELEALGSRLKELIAEDAASFEAVLAAYRLPRETEEEKSERDRRIAAAGQGAIDTPMHTARSAAAVMRLLEELSGTGNRNAFSDLTVGAQLALSSVKGASYNVGVNLGMLEDADQARKLKEELDRLIATVEAAAARLESEMKKQY